jgi:hypothetical protein
MQNEITVVFGRKRTRKTRWTLRELKQRKRVLYIDPKSADLGRPEYGFGVECRTPEAVRDLTERGNNFTIRIPTIDDDWITLLCKQAIYVRNCTVAIDEVELFSDTQRGSVQGIYDILRAGGASGVSFIGSAHRPSDVDIDLLAAADRIVVFQTTHERDIKRLQHYITADDNVFMDLQAPSEEDPMRASHYLEWRVDWGRRYEVKQFSENGKDSEIRGNADRVQPDESEGTEESPSPAGGLDGDSIDS